MRLRKVPPVSGLEIVPGGCTVGPERCGKPVIVVLLSVCVHEHIKRAQFCIRHAERLRAGLLVCKPCATGVEPHSCTAREIESAAGSHSSSSSAEKPEGEGKE